MSILFKILFILVTFLIQNIVIQISNLNAEMHVPIKSQYFIPNEEETIHKSL